MSQGQFHEAIGQAARIAFPDSRPRLPLYGVAWDLRIAVLDGRLRPNGRLGFLVLRQPLLSADEKLATIRVDRIHAPSIIHSEGGRILSINLDGTQIIPPGTLAIDLKNIHGSRYNDEHVRPQSFPAIGRAAVVPQIERMLEPAL
jgi:hypothetical protein